MGNPVRKSVSIVKATERMDFKTYTTEDFVCDESFRNYCSGVNPEDILFWESWINGNPEKIPELEEAKRLLTILNARQGNVREQLGQLKDGLKRFEYFKETISGKTVAGPDRVLPGLRRTRLLKLKYAGGIAASVLVVLFAGYLLLPKKQNIPPASAKAVAFHTPIHSGNEPRKTIVLPDGTVVTLHSNSTLTLVDNFSKENRELTLSGEAFFDVTHDEQHPFLVHTADVNIEVLGTLFNVNAYPQGAFTETSLFRGKVAVSIKDHPEQKVILKPSQKLVVANGKISQPAEKEILKVASLSVDPVNHKAKEIAWVRSRIKIDDEPLKVIAERLQAWYGIPITITDKDVQEYRYSGTFESETVMKALEALQLSYPFSFRTEGDKIIIDK